MLKYKKPVNHLRIEGSVTIGVAATSGSSQSLMNCMQNIQILRIISSIYCIESGPNISQVNWQYFTQLVLASPGADNQFSTPADSQGFFSGFGTPWTYIPNQLPYLVHNYGLPLIDLKFDEGEFIINGAQQIQFTDSAIIGTAALGQTLAFSHFMDIVYEGLSQ
jgi:hypothetical protein